MNDRGLLISDVYGRGLLIRDDMNGCGLLINDAHGIVKLFSIKKVGYSS